MRARIFADNEAASPRLRGARASRTCNRRWGRIAKGGASALLGSVSKRVSAICEEATPTAMRRVLSRTAGGGREADEARSNARRLAPRSGDGGRLVDVRLRHMLRREGSHWIGGGWQGSRVSGGVGLRR